MKSCTCTSPQPTYISYGIDVNFEPHTTIVCSTCDGASLGIFDRIQAGWYDSPGPEVVDGAHYFLGVDSYNNTQSYCLTKHIENNVEVVSSESIDDNKLFESEVKRISKYYNAVIITENPEIEPSKPIICGTGGEFSEWIDGEAYFHQMWDIEASNIYQNPDEIGQGLREDAIPTYNPNDGFSLEMLEDWLKILNKRSPKTNYQDDISSVAVEPHKKQYPIKKWFDKFRK